VYATGDAFPPEGISVSEATQIINDFASAFSTCSEIASKLTVKDPAPAPTLRIIKLESSSFDSLFSLNFPSSYAVLAPLLPAYAADIISSKSWELFYKALKILVGSAKIFKEHGRPAFFNFIDCLNFTININIGSGTISCPKFMKKIIQRTNIPINNIAQLLKQGKVKELTIKSDISPDEIKDFESDIAINEENCDDYSTHETEELDNSLIDILCRPYIINKNKKVGKLDYHDGERWVQSIGFTIEDGDVIDYIDAMKRESATLTARRKFILNSLGEKKISHLFLTQVHL
jgi:hypothetical protein